MISISMACQTSRNILSFFHQIPKLMTQILLISPQSFLPIQDYAFWGFLLSRIGCNPYSSVEVMKMAVDNAWKELDNDYVKKCCASFP